MLVWLIDLERRRLVNLCEPSSAVHGGTGGMFTQNLAVMSEIPLDLGSPDQEGKLYSAESLNNLHKMTVCTDRRDLLSAPPPTSPKGPPQRLEEAVSDGLPPPNPGILASLLHLLRPDALVGSEDEERISPQRVHQSPVRGAWLLLAAMLLTGLLLSFCAIYLIDYSRKVLLHFHCHVTDSAKLGGAGRAQGKRRGGEASAGAQALEGTAGEEPGYLHLRGYRQVREKVGRPPVEEVVPCGHFTERMLNQMSVISA